MHPISSKFFGNTANSIGVDFHNGTSVVGGYIVKQLGSRKFKVTHDGSTMYDRKLAQVNNPPQAGEMTIAVFPFANGVVSGTAEHVKNITSVRVDTIEGHHYTWELTATKAGQAQINAYDASPLAFAFTSNATANGTTNIPLAPHTAGTITTYTVTANPIHGTVGVAANGVATYHSTSVNAVTDHFTFQVSNEFNTGNAAIVTLNVH